MPAFVDAFRIESDGVLRHDIAALSEMMQRKFPSETKQTVQVAMHILAMTRATLVFVLKRAEEADVQWVGPSEEIRESLVADLLELAGRLDLYEFAMAPLRPDETVPPSVFPLLFFLEQDGGVPFSTPEWLTPFIVDNQIIELEQHRREVQSFFRELMDRTIELVRDPLPGFADFSNVAEGMSPGQMALVGGIAALGIGYLLGRRR